MTPLRFVSAMIAIALLHAARPLAAEPSKAAQPNIVFILADDMGYMDLGCYGSDLYQTPNIDRLAKQGLRFTNAYAACHVCSPTRGSIQSGQYPARTRLTNIPDAPNPYRKVLEPPQTRALPPGTATIGQLLKKEGYATAWFGKWHIAGGAQESGYDAGNQNWSLNRDPSETDPKGVMRLTNEATEFMAKNHDKPMFIGVSHYAVHSPVHCNSKVKAKYDKLVMPDKRQQSAAYAAMTEALDDSVGVLMKAIEDQHFKRETVVMFFSDNGGATKFTSNAPLRAGKGWFYEGGIREPLIVYWPGKVRPGTTTDEVVTSIDFLPTFLQLAGCKAPPKCDGLSLLPVLTDNAHLPRETVYWHFPHYHNCSPCGALRKGNYKLIEYFEDGKVELYDLSKDLSEKQDLSKAMPEKTAELLADLRAWRKSLDAQMPSPNPNYDPAKAKLSSNKLKKLVKAQQAEESAKRSKEKQALKAARKAKVKKSPVTLPHDKAGSDDK